MSIRVRFVTRDGWERGRDVEALHPTQLARLLVSPARPLLGPADGAFEESCVEKVFELKTIRDRGLDEHVYVEPGGEVARHKCAEVENLREENRTLRELCGWAFRFFVEDIGVTGLLYAESFDKHQLQKLKTYGEAAWRDRQRALGLER